MAKSPAKAMELMMRVWPAAVARVNEEVADMKPFAAKDGVTTDRAVGLSLSTRRRSARRSTTSARTRLSPISSSTTWSTACSGRPSSSTASKFTENTGKVPVFHPDVRTFEVTNAKTGDVIGLFYLDMFARKGKRSGAWATTYRSRAGLLGDNIVLGSNNNNFTKPAAGRAGADQPRRRRDAVPRVRPRHPLSACRDVNYPCLGGTPRDFVEYPSQVNENWLLTRTVLDKFARHYKTGQPMPQALVEKIEASETFNQGFATVEYLSSALVDMMLHTRAGRRGRSRRVRARDAGRARHAARRW